MVNIEDQTSVTFLERKPTIAAYRRITEALVRVALSEDESRDLIARRASELGKTREDHVDIGRRRRSHLAAELFR